MRRRLLDLSSHKVGLEVISSVDAAKEQVKFGEFALKQSRLAYYKQVETFKNLTEFVED